MQNLIHAFATSDYRRAYAFASVGAEPETITANTRAELAAKLLERGLSESKKKPTLFLPFPQIRA